MKLLLPPTKNTFHNNGADYEYSCANFGLYRTTVGTDTGNDMLEHVTTYKEQEEQARIQAEQASISVSIAQSEAESASIAEEQKAIDKANRNSTIKVVVIVLIVIVAIAGTLTIIRYINVVNARKHKRRRRK